MFGQRPRAFNSLAGGFQTAYDIYGTSAPPRPFLVTGRDFIAAPVQKCGESVQGGDPAMPRRGVARLLALSVVVATPLVAARSGAVSRPQAEGPIRHIVFVMQENHSLDDVFGKFCEEVALHQITRAGLNEPCHGATQATLQGGEPATSPSSRIPG